MYNDKVMRKWKFYIDICAIEILQIIVIMVNFISKITNAYINIIADTAKAMWTTI